MQYYLSAKSASLTLTSDASVRIPGVNESLVLSPHLQYLPPQVGYPVVLFFIDPQLPLKSSSIYGQCKSLHHVFLTICHLISAVLFLPVSSAFASFKILSSTSPTYHLKVSINSSRFNRQPSTSGLKQRLPYQLLCHLCPQQTVLGLPL